jgi:cysteine-rich repeat protein
MVEVTGGELDWGDGAATDKSWLETGVNSNYTRLWDSGPSGGYFDRAATNWSSKWGKGFTPTVDAITTHALLLSMMTDEPVHDARLFELADNIVEHLVGNMSISGIGFPEVFDSSWKVDHGQVVADIGHHYKTAWSLQRAYLMDPSRTEYKQAADAILWDLWNHGAYDRVYGGPYSKLNWQTGNIVDQGKNNWMLEQGITAGLISYHSASSQADRDMFLEVADGSVRFFMEHQLDPVYGEAYSDVSRDGSSQVIADKGGLFNSGYHSIETGYYLYLYGSLFYHKTPAALYYKFPAGVATRDIRLTPLAIEDELLKIQSVELDGAAFTNFDSTSRTLTLAAGVGGIFKVTFGVGPFCGDGNVDPGEQCDDGNADNADTCLDTCVLTSCGLTRLKAVQGQKSPVPLGTVVTFKALVNDACVEPQYRFSARMHDGTSWSSYSVFQQKSPKPKAPFSPTEPGLYQIRVQVRDSDADNWQDAKKKKFEWTGAP